MKTKHAELLLIILLVLFDGASPTRITHKLKVTNDNNKIIIYYESPCDDAVSLVRDSKSKYATPYAECNYGYKHSNYVLQQCKGHYQNNWITAVKDLATCNLHIRNERNVIDIIQKPAILSVATNLLKTIFTPGEKEDIINNIKNEYNINNHLYVNIMRDSITISSNTIKQEDAVASNQMPPDIWSLFQAHKSISSKSALVRTISRTCKETGTLDTKAIGELIGDPSFLQLQHNSTHITGININLEKSKITITYRSDQEVSMEESGADPVPNRESNPSTVR